MKSATLKNDWDSLFFTYRPHADQQPHEARLLADMGLTRTALGELARIEEPARPIGPPRRTAWQMLADLWRSRLYARRPYARRGKSVSGSASAMR